MAAMPEVAQVAELDVSKRVPGSAVHPVAQFSGKNPFREARVTQNRPHPVPRLHHRRVRQSISKMEGKKPSQMEMPKSKNGSPPSSLSSIKIHKMRNMIKPYSIVEY
jgi:hypothetical protein